MDEYARLSREWESARSEDARSRLEADLVAAARDIVTQWQTPPLPPWADGSSENDSWRSRWTFEYASTGPDGWKLSDADNELVFRWEILPQAMAGVSRPVGPVLAYIGGQAASGKTTAQRAAMERMGTDGALIADFDALLEFSPVYRTLMAEDDRTAARRVGGDAWVWMNKIIDTARKNRLNLIRESAMGGAEGAVRDSELFHELGYRVEADVMAVPEAISRLAILNRYQRMRDEYGYGRLVARNIHDEAVVGLPETMGAVDELAFLDAITLRRWGGHIVYSNSLDAEGNWQGPAKAEETLEKERLRPFTEEEVRWFRETYAYLDAELTDEFRPELLEIAELAARHGVEIIPQTISIDGAREETSVRDMDIADQEPQAAPVHHRERLLQDYQRRLAETHPADGEAVWKEFSAEWARLARQVGMDRTDLRILAYCTEWDPHKGGIVAVNRNLVEGLAAAGHEVFVRVGHEVPPDVPGSRIHLIGPRHYDPGRGEQEQLVYDGEELPSNVDAIIGHSRYSGPEALRVRDERYPDTPFVQVVHMVTGALARVAKRPDLEVEFEGIERRMVASADMVAAVGPTLEKEARRLAATNPGDHVPAVHQIIPGVPFEEQRLPLWDGERTRHVLLVGRGDAPQKGAHHAALMVRRLLGEGIDAQLTVRGASPETVEEVKERLSAIVGREVVVKPFSIDRGDLLSDMRQADVMVMPSRAEGFGLVGLEAAGAGLPVVLPSTSGVGSFFGDPSRFPPEITRLMLVEQSFEGEVDIERWTRNLREILLDIPAARGNALSLQRLLREADTTWVGAARALAAGIRAIPDRAASRPRAPELPAMVGDGWVNCAEGHPHWGRFGAAGLLPVHRAANGEAFALMHHRGPDTDQGGTWALLGGARDSHESPTEAAIREAAEESTLRRADVRVERVVRDDHGGWTYDIVIATADRLVSFEPIDGETMALAWVPVSEVRGLNLHPGFAQSWPKLQSEIEAVLNGGQPAIVRAGATPRTSALPLPVHPVTAARVVARQALGHGEGISSRELATFEDGTRAVYEKYVRTEDARVKVLDSYVGRAVGARIPLSHPVGLREVYTDHMLGEPASTRHRDLADLADQGMPSTRDGVFLGLYHALTAVHGVTTDQLVLGGRQSLIAAEVGTASHAPSPDAANPFVRTFFRETETHMFSWVDNPISPGDIEIMGRQLEDLRPLFDQFGRTDLFHAYMERFDRVAEHATGTDRLLPRAPGHQVTPQNQASGEHTRQPPLLDSPERIDQQRIAEALLSDDGRISGTSQAKTIAIGVLAQRMRTSTPELVVSAFGLNVGTDMVERLGDHQYVLVPLNEQYPSMGADVLHVDELDPAEPGHAPDRVIRMDRPEADALVRRISVSELMGAWSYGSNNNVRVLALQEATKEEFGLPRVLEWNPDSETRKRVEIELLYSRDALRDFVRTQYEMTQGILAERGVSELIGYRALTWQEGAPRPDWADLNVGAGFQMLRRPLESWSADRQVVADWLDTRGGPGVILADLMPAQDILSLPTTGMGYLRQKEWVALPGDRPSTLDGISAGRTQERAVERTTASSVNVGGPVLGDDRAALVEEPMNPPDAQSQGSDGRWRPLEITSHRLNPADPFDRRMIRIFEGEEQYPDWWPRDDSGYAIAKRDLDFLGIDPVQIKWMVSREAPMGMTPELYDQFGTEMLEALRRDGFQPEQVDIRLKGTGADVFSGMHKTLPNEEELADKPEAARRMREWFGDSAERPLRRPYDAMWRLGLASVPSDFDLDINSTAMIRAARERWKEQRSDRYPGDFMGGHGYLDKQAVKDAFPELAEWANKWEKKLGRELSLGAFESSGPVDATKFGRSLSGHFRSTDWVIHNSDQPWDARTPGGTRPQARDWSTEHAKQAQDLMRRGELAAGGMRPQAQNWLTEYWKQAQDLIERGDLGPETAPAMLELHAQADRVAAVAYKDQGKQLAKHDWYQKVQKEVFLAGQRGVDNAALPSSPKEYFSATQEERRRYVQTMKTTKTARRPQPGLASPGTRGAKTSSPAGDGRSREAQEGPDLEL
ncbi:zeta toxin family protein [Nocardiopsis sp. N85]|uniref:zeta toxin family protein n=1 Tax=Nocardiopsis sp. N85 TaxID=3029400 RepID=UPI00237F99D8|nr:zeta toxin family protein [Nocardiopsis sp. N85]MDE3724908.1 zeta toxin family protein [Nocardiopsis sp. N85]